MLDGPLVERRTTERRHGKPRTERHYGAIISAPLPSEYEWLPLRLAETHPSWSLRITRAEGSCDWRAWVGDSAFADRDWLAASVCQATGDTPTEAVRLLGRELFYHGVLLGLMPDQLNRVYGSKGGDV